MHQNPFYTIGLLQQKPFNTRSFDTRTHFRKQLYTRSHLHQKPFNTGTIHVALEDLYTRNLFTPEASCARNFLHQEPLPQTTLHQKPFTLETFYTRNPLHHKPSHTRNPFRPEGFPPGTIYTKPLYTKGPLHQKLFWIRSLLHEKPRNSRSIKLQSKKYNKIFLHSTKYYTTYSPLRIATE